ncbi:YgaP family membrane protein [Halorientalis salina]|uniref:YgaP family membrane protein n=1 Tax=Halorientalis salina TaxID=2932266 RepID=UPI0010AC2AC8|nr:DUF2892 domain-containing protein [Halorientalis salina]
MDKNVGGYDRIARLVAGPILLVLGIAALAGMLTLAEGTVGTALAVIALLIGVVFLGTALTQKCPLNSLLGIDTCPVS